MVRAQIWRTPAMTNNTHPHAAGRANTNKPKPSHRRRTASALLVLITIVGVLAATPAEAAVKTKATTSYAGGTAVNLRSGPSTTSKVVRSVRSGTALTVTCQTTGTAIGYGKWSGNRTWNKLSDGTYVHDVLTTLPGNGTKVNHGGGRYSLFSKGISRCSAPKPAPKTSRESKAVSWARSQVGVRHTSLTSDGMWSGWCERFAELAYGTSGRYGSAAANYRAQKAAGRLKTTGTPPAGALVFYEWGAYGHVAISTGGGKAISTQGYETALPVKEHTINGIGLRYLGWSAAPTNWSGR